MHRLLSFLLFAVTEGPYLVPPSQFIIAKTPYHGGISSDAAQ